MKIANNLLRNIKGFDEKQFTYMSVRLKPEYYYMLDLMAHLNKESIGSILTEDISDYIFKLIITCLLDNSTDEEVESLLKKLPVFILYKLEKEGIIEYTNDDKMTMTKEELLKLLA